MLFALAKGFMLGLAIALPVGPTNVEVARRTCQKGKQAAFLFLAGVMTVLVVYLAALSFGLAAILKGEFLQKILAVFGLAVLTYLAVYSLNEYRNFKPLPLEFNEGAAPKTDYWAGVLLTIGNPGVIAIWTGILGANFALAADRAIIIPTIIGIILADICFISALIMAVNYGKRFLNPERARFIPLLAGLILLFFAVSYGIEAVKLFV